MGYNGAIHLAGLGFHVFAAVYMDDSAAKLRVEAGAERWAKITPLQLDVTNTDSINVSCTVLFRSATPPNQFKYSLPSPTMPDAWPSMALAGHSLE